MYDLLQKKSATIVWRGLSYCLNRLKTVYFFAFDAFPAFLGFSSTIA